MRQRDYDALDLAGTGKRATSYSRFARRALVGFAPFSQFDRAYVVGDDCCK